MVNIGIWGGQNYPEEGKLMGTEKNENQHWIWSLITSIHQGVVG